MKKRILGFTLAEVLITLSIIGIVAALTIPTLINSYQKSQYVVGLKKAFSTVSQAFQQMSVDAGCPGNLECVFDKGADMGGNFVDSYTNDVNAMGDKVASSFKTVKKCPYMGSSGCWAPTVATNFDGTDVQPNQDATNAGYRFVTEDGMMFLIPSGPNRGCWGSAGDFRKVCYPAFYVDVNGLKAPNIYGRDIFLFLVAADNGVVIYPYGGKKYVYWQSNGCNKGYESNTSVAGTWCAGRVMEEGWQMNY